MVSVLPFRVKGSADVMPIESIPWANACSFKRAVNERLFVKRPPDIGYSPGAARLEDGELNNIGEGKDAFFQVEIVDAGR